MKPKIGITLGDGHGIGPEVVLKALSHSPLYWQCTPVLIADKTLLHYWTKALGISLPKKVELVDLNFFSSKQKFFPGRLSAAVGRGALAFVREGARLALEKKIGALVTAPLSKEAIKRSGTSFVGHTEYLAKLSRTKKVSMMFVGGGLKMVLATTHIPFNRIVRALSLTRVFQAIEQAHAAGKLFGIKNPHLAVAALNPHAGEGGMFGKEEKKIILPAMRKAWRKKIKVSGPYPADTLFYQVLKEKKIDCIVTLYHDQGLIPLKTLAFEECVNVTLGLPFVRTSPDHGTAFSIAGKGIANPSSMLAAIKLATQLTAQK